MLVGRDAERARIAALLDAARTSVSGALVLRGEPGIGKTALLQDALAHAEGMHVLRARGIESESELAFGGIHQLLRPALDHVDALPPPQAAALRRALGLEDGAIEERFLVSVACLSLLSELSEDRPVLCVVDDAHWLDAASSDALVFAARRLGAEGVAVLFAARDGDVRQFVAPDVPSVVLGGLDEASAGALLRAGTKGAAESVEHYLVTQAHGNALALVELPQALSPAQLAGVEPLPVSLPLTQQVERVFLERVRRLPDVTQRALLVAAADDTEDLRVVTGAASLLGIDASALDAAEQAGLVHVHGSRLEFRHPLVRSAVYQAATSGDRRTAHGALANNLEGRAEEADRHAWHLVASEVTPSAESVQSLERAAARAEERAGHIVAANAFERAAELSVDPDVRARRLVAAARNLSIAGRNDRAVGCADRAAAHALDPRLQATLAQIRGVAAIRDGRPREVVPVLVEAAKSVAPMDPVSAVGLLMDACVAAWQGGDAAQFAAVAELAATVTPPAGDESTARLIRSFTGFHAVVSGDLATGTRLLTETVEWADTALDSNHLLWASFAAFWLGDSRRFGALTDRAAALARERGELGALADALGMRATQLAFDQSPVDDVALAAGEALQLAQELGAANLELLPRTALAMMAAIQGRDEEARITAEEVLSFATRNGLALRVSAAVYVLALVDLGRGRWLDALERLDALAERSATLDPMARATLPDRIEAAVRAGREREAREALPLLEARAAAGVRSARPRLSACRALLATSDEASAHFEDALRLGEDARPFDLARIQLQYGEHLRRERRRVDARAQLRAALRTFERFGAEPWAERARAELRASGETARKRDPSTVDQLTPQELQIARFVAEGLSNKEVAAQLFLSPRTIDYHLRNVFVKLGISSRTQLARVSLDAGDGVVGSAVPSHV